MLCSAPWTTVQIKNDGQMSYCCMSRDPMSDSINGEELVRGRREMIAGKILPVCQEKCLDIEHLFSSQRHELNTRWPIEHDISPEANPEHIKYIDLRMGNICNYMCLMCGDRDSHLWGKANGKENPYISWAMNEDKYNHIMDFISSCTNLKSISLAGGEPFYNKKQLFDLLDRLPRELDLKFITNVSFCDDEIIAKLNEFKTGRLHCSVDGIGTWIETQRHKSKWRDVEANLLKFAGELHDDWTVRLVPTFTVLNTPGVVEFVAWFNEVLLKTRADARFAFTICQQPERMTLYNLPLDYRINLAQQIQDLGYDSNSTIRKLTEAIARDIVPNEFTKDDLGTYLGQVNDKLGVDVVKIIPQVGEVVGK